MEHVRDRLSDAGKRLRENAWIIVQKALAATVAFLVASWLGDHPSPFFAPIAAVISLNTDLGERGVNALKLLLGVVTGIVAGELSLLAVDDQVVALGVGTLVAVGVSTAGGGSALVVAQAASAAILTVSTSDGSAGPERLVDALIGTGVALVFTQLLFTPNPRHMLNRAESTALSSIAAGLREASEALGSGDDDRERAALASLRGTRDNVSDIAKARARSQRTARHSLIRRGYRKPLVAETENAAYLDILSDNAVVLVRLAMSGEQERRRALRTPLGEVADILDELAEAPEDRDTRQRVVDEDVPRLLRSLRPEDTEPNDAVSTAFALGKALIGDLMLFAGADHRQVRDVFDENVTDVRADPDDPDDVVDRVGSWARKALGGLHTVKDRLSRTKGNEKDDQEHRALRRHG